MISNGVRQSPDHHPPSIRQSSNVPYLTFMSNIKHNVCRIGQYTFFVVYVFHVGQLDEYLDLWGWIRQIYSVFGID